MVPSPCLKQGIPPGMSVSGAALSACVLTVQRLVGLMRLPNQPTPTGCATSRRVHTKHVRCCCLQKRRLSFTLHDRDTHDLQGDGCACLRSLLYIPPFSGTCKGHNANELMRSSRMRIMNPGAGHRCLPGRRLAPAISQLGHRSQVFYPAGFTNDKIRFQKHTYRFVIGRRN